MRTAWIVAFFLSCLGAAWADTEILNFHLPLPSGSASAPAAALASGAGAGAGAEIYETKFETSNDSLILSPSQPLTFVLSSSFPNRTIFLEFGDSDSSAWTIRASWPGSHPARIALSDPTDEGFFIKGSPLSPRMPHPLLLHLPTSLQILFTPTSSKAPPASALSPAPDAASEKEAFSTPVILVLEPLVLGIIPQTAVPTIGVILLVVFSSGLLVPRVVGLIERLVNPAEGVVRHGKTD
ncbi:hypothetical protein IAT40_003140 [Kwoniella sp. CBS 6097]